LSHNYVLAASRQPPHHSADSALPFVSKRSLPAEYLLRFSQQGRAGQT
jgi:hypothetical protein